MQAKLYSLLVVESNPADSYLTAEALKQAGPIGQITIIEDSQLALEHLDGPSAPDMIFLDLNLVPIDGLEVLRKIRAHPRLCTIPVVIMSGSERAEDVHQSYQCGANCYITKPSSLNEFLRFMKISYEFWGSVATLPPHPQSTNGRVK